MSEEMEHQLPGQDRTTAARLFAYIGLFKKTLAFALVLLVLSVAAQLAGPLIAKVIIDEHILSVEQPWYEWSAGSESQSSTAGSAPGEAPRSITSGHELRTITIRGQMLVRADWLAATGWETVAAGGAGESGATVAGAGVAGAGAAAGAAEAGGAPVSDGALGVVGPQAQVRQEGLSFVLSSPSLGEIRLAPAEVAELYRHEVQPVLWLVALIFALAAVGSVLTFVQSYLLQATAQRIVQRIRTDVYNNLHRIAIRYFDQTPVGQLVSRIANDTENVKELYVSFMATFVVSGLYIVGVYAALFYLDWRLALVCLVLLPLYATILVVHLKFSRKYVAAIRARLAEMNAQLNESIQAMPVIQAFRAQKRMREDFEQLNADRYRNQVLQFRIFAFSGRNAVYLLGRSSIALIVWYFGGASLQSAISLGVLFAFIDYLGRIFEPIIGIFDQMMNAQRAVVSAERVFSLMDRRGEPVQEARDVPRPQGRVEFNNVTFSYVPGEPVLKGISFAAEQGQTIALVGHTGSGKSSVMNLLLGFYDPDSGEIRIDGKAIGSMSRQALRKHMGIVLQDPFLFTGDIRFNVSLYDKQLGDEAVLRSLREVGAERMLEKLPHGLHEPVVERGSTLSAGERQLISFARALAYDPAILILDEATSSIDSETEALIQHALEVLRHGRTTFIIAHRLSTIRDADCILVLHRGEIVERGTHEELLAQGGRYARMYELQHSE